MEDLKSFLSNRINLLLFIAGLIFCFQIFTIFGNGREELKVNYIKKEVQALKDDVSNIYKSERDLDKKIEKFNIEIKNIHEAVTVNNQKIENLKKNEKVQVDNFKSFDARKYEQYFTDRYSKQKNGNTIK